MIRDRLSNSIETEKERERDGGLKGRGKQGKVEARIKVGQGGRLKLGGKRVAGQRDGE